MSERPRRVVVVGAGLSGLAAAYACREQGLQTGRPIDVVVLEAARRAGGWVGTDQLDGFHVERGADGFLNEKKSVAELAERLGIRQRIVGTRPGRGGAAVVFRGALHPIPEGFSLLAPTRVRPILRTALLSWKGKLRLALELALPRGPARDDESLASFVRRRFGNEVLTRLAQPLAGGIYGADPERLSLRATMPRFLDEERRSRSVSLGLRRRALASASQQASGARYALFSSFDNGMQVLVDALTAALPSPDLRLGAAATAIEISSSGVRVRVGGENIAADAVILAVPAPRIASLLAPVDAALVESFSAIDHGSAATVALGYRGADLRRRLPGYGFVVPAAEGRASIAGTFASQKWPNRAPPGHELVRVFLGGPAGPPIDASDEALIAAAREELRDLLGVEARPVLEVVHRYPRAMPRYEVGHLARVAEIERRLAAYPCVRVAGNSLHGVGIPDAIAAGERAAASLFA